MKKFYPFVLLLLVATTSFAGTKTLIQSTANVLDPNAWQGGQLPQAGDTVIIPVGKILTMATSLTFPFSTQLRIYGELHLTGTPISISLDPASSIIIFSGGKLTGTVSTQTVFLNGLQIYNGTQTINGAMWAALSTNGFVPFGGFALPVKFVGFTVTDKNNDALVQWSTAEELGADFYEIERSLNGSSWNAVGRIAAAGKSTNLSNYSFTDKNLTAKVVYYRIKEVDIDGSQSYTAIRLLNRETRSSSIKIASVQNKVLLQFPQEINGKVSVRFISLTGQIVDQQIISNPVGQVVLNSKVRGNYIISVSNAQDFATSGQVIL